MKKPKLPVYNRRLYAVRQVFVDQKGKPYDVRYGADIDSAIPFLYTLAQLDPGQLSFGMEDYVEVEVTIRPLRAKRVADALPSCKMPPRRRGAP